MCDSKMKRFYIKYTQCPFNSYFHFPSRKNVSHVYLALKSTFFLMRCKRLFKLNDIEKNECDYLKFYLLIYGIWAHIIFYKSTKSLHDYIIYLIVVYFSVLTRIGCCYLDSNLKYVFQFQI